MSGHPVTIRGPKQTVGSRMERNYGVLIGTGMYYSPATAHHGGRAPATVEIVAIKTPQERAESAGKIKQSGSTGTENPLSAHCLGHSVSDGPRRKEERLGGSAVLGEAQHGEMVDGCVLHHSKAWSFLDRPL